MADLQPHSIPQQTGLEHQTHNHNGIQETQESVQVPDGQYQGVSASHVVPTKTGDEEAVNEPQFDDERRRTSGTAHSGNTDFDNTEDGAILASLTVPKARNGDRTAKPLSPSRSIGSLLARPMSEDDRTPEEAFSFAKVSHQQLDFAGTRKGSATHAAPTRPEIVQDSQPDTVAAPVDQLEAAPEINGEASQLPSLQPAAEVKGKKKRKKKKKRRYDTAPTELTEQYPVAGPADGMAVYQSVEAPEVADGEQHINVVEAFEPAPEYQGQPRPATPMDMIGSGRQEVEASSPHTQLHDDLQAAAFEQERSMRFAHDDMASQHAQPAEAEALEAEPLNAAMNNQYSPNVQSRDVCRTDTRRRTSSRPDTGRVAKRKSKVGRKATAPAPTETLHSDQSTSDVNDYLQILAFKVQQKQQSASSRLAAERESMTAELQQILDAKQALQDELDAMQQQKSNLTTTLEKQKTKTTAYESKISKFKTFVDGLGNDIDALKKEASITHRKGEQLEQEGEDRKAEQNALFEQLSACAEKSAQLKDEALKACQDAQLELQAAHLRNNYLEQQLSERVGLLAEERDRRSQLEKQLATAASSDEAVVRALKSNNNAVLDKLFEIHAVIEEAESDKKTSEMVEKALAAVQALTSQHSTNADNIISVKDMIDSLSESVNGLCETAGATREGHGSDVASLQAHLDDALKGLRADLGQREKLIQRDAVHREMINILNDKLKASNIRVADRDSKLSAAETREKQLKEENTSLQAKVTAMQSKFTPSDSTHVQLSELKADLDVKAGALESTKADLSSKAEELRSLSATNASLREQMQGLQRQLEEVQSTLVDFGPERTSLERKFKAELEKIQTEMAEHSRQTHVKDRMGIDNKLKSLTHSRDELQKQVKPLKDELAASKSQFEHLRKQSSESAAEKEHQLQDLRKLAQSKQQEVETLQASLDDLHAKLEGNDPLKDQYAALSSQLNAEQIKHKETAGEKEALAKQVEEVQLALETAQSVEEEAKAELEKYRTENATTLEDMENELEEANQATERAEAGAQLLDQTFKKAMAEAEGKSDRQIKALQQSLKQVQDEVENKKSEAEGFHAQIEKAWNEEKARNDEQITQAKNLATEAETQRDEALAENERLRKELEEVSKKQSEVIRLQLERAKQQSVQQRPPSRGSDASASRFRVPTLREGITPTPDNKENEPPKPRKKVDRNANMVIEAGPVPAPRVLRRPKSRTKDAALAEATIRSPVVEESQLRDVVLVPVFKTSHKPLPSGVFSDSDDMLDTASMRSKQLPQVVEETQYKDKLPSFAAFHNSLASSQAPRSKAASSVFSVPSLRSTNDRHRVTNASTTSKEVHKGQATQVAQPASNDFVIYEDSQQVNVSQSTRDGEARRHLQDSLSWSQAEKDKYTFRKAYPNPNSASKMVHKEVKESHGTKRRRSDHTSASTSHEDAMQTPKVRGEGGDSTSRGMRPPNAARVSAMHSSSPVPDFVLDATHARKTTYHTPGGSGSARRRSSRTNPVPTADPRLAGREAPAAPKRKAEGRIVEGYEQERQKRLKQGSAATAPAEPSRYSLRASTHQPSIHDLPSFSSMSGKSGSQLGGSSQSRMRTLAGSSTRGRPGLKKMSKNDEANARFAQELNR